MGWGLGRKGSVRSGKVERTDLIDKNKPAQGFSILAMTRSLSEEPSNAAKT